MLEDTSTIHGELGPDIGTVLAVEGILHILEPLHVGAGASVFLRSSMAVNNKTEGTSKCTRTRAGAKPVSNCK